MFYSADLLTIKRHGKFAKCWLAAHMTRGAFYSKFRRESVNPMNIVETCEELIVYVVTETGNKKLSLYLKAQLMFGLTRLLFYQVDTLLKQQWELYDKITRMRIHELEENLTNKKRPKNKLPAVLPQDVLIDLPRVNQKSQVTMVDIVAQITLQENNVDRAHELAMQTIDLSHFGMMTMEEMDAILMPGDEAFFDAEESSRVISVLEREGDHPEPSVFQLPIMRQNVTEEGHGLSNIPLPDHRQDFTDENLLRTPTKHKLSPRTDEQTPSKRSRTNISNMGEKGDTTPSVLIPAPITIPPPQSPQPQSPQPQPQQRAEQDQDAFITLTDEIVLNPLDNNVATGKAIAKKHKQRTHDKQLQERAQLMEARRQDLHYATAKQIVVDLRRVNASHLLLRPSIRTVWGSPLLANYQMTITNLKCQLDTDKKQDKFKDDSQPNGELPEPLEIPRDVIRSPDIAIPEGTGNLSSDPFPGPINLADGSSNIHETKSSEQPTIQEPATRIVLPVLVEGQDSSSGPPILPDEAVSGMKETVEELSVRDSEEWVPQRILPPNAVDVPSNSPESRHTSSQCSGASFECRAQELVRREQEMLASAKVLWAVNKVVDFEDICPPSANNKLDASKAFGTLLALHKSKKVLLQQAEPFSNIYIIEPY